MRRRVEELEKEKERVGGERDEAMDKLERMRAQIKDKERELIESQSANANAEERLLIIEQHLITAKASWANAEHEREQMFNYT